MLASCGGGREKAENIAAASASVQALEPGVEVLYFHRKRRCVTCRAIEKVASETVAEKYARQMADGKVRFTVIDMDTPEGEAAANEYRVARPSLLVTSRKADGSVIVEEMTEAGFANARRDPEAFGAILCEAINRQLD